VEYGDAILQPFALCRAYQVQGLPDCRHRFVISIGLEAVPRSLGAPYSVIHWKSYTILGSYVQYRYRVPFYRHLSPIRPSLGSLHYFRHFRDDFLNLLVHPIDFLSSPFASLFLLINYCGKVVP
jgi:hypothetical protein